MKSLVSEILARGTYSQLKRIPLKHLFKSTKRLNNKPNLVRISNPKTHRKPRVGIILAHYNGENFISDQVQSISPQTYRNFEINIFEDYSNPCPINKLYELPEMGGERIFVRQNTRNYGFCRNILHGLKNIGANYEYFSLPDQDDIWHPEKLERAIDILSMQPSDKPAFYCSRTQIVDSRGKIHLEFSPHFTKNPSFGNALMQNIGGGNTMVLNKAARDLVVEASQGVNVVSHDWWTYIMVSDSGGFVYYDSIPSLKYRQHSNSLVWSNISWSARVKRVFGLLKEQFMQTIQLVSKITYFNKKKMATVYA